MARPRRHAPRRAGRSAPAAERPTPRSPRAVAIDVLVRVEDGAFANLALPAALRHAATFSDRDRAFATELVYGTLREQRALDFRIEPHLTRPLPALDPPVRAALRMGTYQLVHDIPAHAAVGETVATVPARARGFVNAVLRRVATAGTEPPADTTVAATAIRASMPDWIAERFAADFDPATAIALLEAAAEPPLLTLRTADPAGVAAELEAAGARVEPGVLMPTALRVRGAGDPKRIAAVADGRATPQDEASQAVAAIAAATITPGARVLDVCAAPGGKSLALAAAGARVVSADLDPGRVRTLARNASRARTALDLLVADARALPLHATFATVLVDAPCSGLGVLRRRPDARWRLRPDDVDELARLQREILAATIPHVGPGGHLVYSVCTVTAAETIEVDEWLAQAHPELHAVPPPPAPWRPHGRGALLLPSAAGTDGMFVLTLRRS